MIRWVLAMGQLAESCDGDRDPGDAGSDDQCPGEQTLRREVERNLTSLIDVIANSIDVSYQQAIGEVQYIAAQPRIRAAAQALFDVIPRGVCATGHRNREQLHQLMQPLLRSKGLRGLLSSHPTDATSLPRTISTSMPHTRPNCSRSRSPESGPGTLITHPLSSDTPGQPPAMFALSPIRDVSGAAIALLALRHDPRSCCTHPAPRHTGRSGKATRSTATACCCRKAL